MARPLTPSETLLTTLLARADEQVRLQTLMLVELRRIRVGVGLLASTDLEAEVSHVD